MITQSRLKEVLDYDSDSGFFIWKVSRGSGRAGNVAGYLHTQGYIRIVIDSRLHFAHRLAFLYMTGVFPENHTDHINGITHDNRWENLRPVTASENGRNQAKPKNNTSGITGVCWNKKSGVWQSGIRVDGKASHLGLFDHIFEAAAARKSAEIKHDFHPNHGRIAIGSRENRRPISNRVTGRVRIKLI